MEIKTIRELAERHPEIRNYNYKWRQTEHPESERDLGDVLAEYGYKLTKEYTGEYNYLQGYLNCEIVPSEPSVRFCAFRDKQAAFMIKDTNTLLCLYCRSVYKAGQASPEAVITPGVL